MLPLKQGGRRVNNRWRQQVDVLMRMADKDLRAVKSAEGPQEVIKLFNMVSEKINKAARIAGCRKSPIKGGPVEELPEAIREDAHCVNMPEEEREMFNAIAGAEEGAVRPEQITMQQMFVFSASIVVSALWVALLLKIGGWIALWLGVM